MKFVKNENMHHPKQGGTTLSSATAKTHFSRGILKKKNNKNWRLSS